MANQRSVQRVEPTSEPLSLDEAKKHLEIPDEEKGHDQHVSALIVAVREDWEHDTQTITTPRTIVEHVDCWPDESWRFYFRPVQSITSIRYYDSANAIQTLDPSVYSPDLPNQKLNLAVGQSWPAITERWDAIELTYVAGQTVVSETAKSAMKFRLDLLFELRGMTKDKDAVQRAYENLVRRYDRASYP